MGVPLTEVVTTLDGLERSGETFLAFPARLADRFARRESREQLAKHWRSPLAPLARKSRWQVAEAVGDAAPDRLQAFVHEPFGGPEGIGVPDETGFLRAPSRCVSMGSP